MRGGFAMTKKARWTYGELLMKRWAISRDLLETFVAEGLPVFDEDNERLVYEDGIPGSIVISKFRVEDVERFERENEHLFEIVPTPIKLNADENFRGEDELGKRLTAEEVAVLFKMNVKKVRSMYKELGGMRLGRSYVFFERRVKDAIQKRTEICCPSAEGREATGEGVSDEEASIAVGKQDAAKTRKRLEREDLHGLFR
jgi:hypothetical protein